MAVNLAYYIAAGLCFVAAAYRALGLRRDRSSSLRAFIVTLSALGAALLVLANPSRSVIDHSSGIIDFARWAGNSLTLVAACAIQIVLAHFARLPDAPSPRAGWRIGICATAIGAMAIAMAASGRPPDAPDFVDRYSDRGAIVIYLIIYSSYLGVAMADTFRLSVRYTRHSPSGFLRSGLFMVAAGSGTGLIYVAHKILFVAFRFERLPFPDRDVVVSPTLAIIASVCIVVGSTIGTWGPRLAGFAHTISEQWTYRQLRPLWAALVAAFPDVVLPAASAPIGYRLYRRAIEIRDGELSLRPYRDPAVVQRIATEVAALGLAGERAAVVIEAAQIAAALRAHREDATPVASTRTSDTDLVQPDLDADHRSEIRRLRLIARAYTRHPLPRRYAGHETAANQPARAAAPPEEPNP